MIRHTMTLAASIALLAACSENPTAPPVRQLAVPRSGSAAIDHTVPGTPGAANCQGQTAAYAAQLAKNLGVEGSRGVAGVARANELSVPELHAVIDEFCTP